MSVTYGFYGEKVTPGRRRLRDEELKRLRARQMYVMRLTGTPTAEIAAFFSFTPQHVNAEIRSIPAPEKRRIERSHHGSSRVA